jgi:hypothetical protein
MSPESARRFGARARSGAGSPAAVNCVFEHIWFTRARAFARCAVEARTPAGDWGAGSQAPRKSSAQFERWRQELRGWVSTIGVTSPAQRVLGAANAGGVGCHTSMSDGPSRGSLPLTGEGTQRRAFPVIKSAAARITCSGLRDVVAEAVMSTHWRS